MSTDLKPQIRSYASQVERRQRSLSVDDVVTPVEYQDGTTVARRSRSYVPPWALTRGPWVAVVTAVVVIVLFGGLALLLPRTDQTTIDDVITPLEDGQSGYYFPSTTPDGFTLRDIETRFGRTSATYLRETPGVWTPNDGGLVVETRGLPSSDDNPDTYIQETLELQPEASPVEVAGYSGLVHESHIEQGSVSVSRVAVLAVDSFGSVFEVAGVGMSREEVLEVAEDLVRISFEEFADRRYQLGWDVRAQVVHEDFAYDQPPPVDDLATTVELVLGRDLILSHLEFSPNLGPDRDSYFGHIYLEVPEGTEDGVLAELRDEVWLVELSPRLVRDRLDAYIEYVRGRGSVLSRDPFVVQAPASPEPRFDVSALGTEHPLLPATSADVIPPYAFEGFLFQGDDLTLATEARPLVVIGASGDESDEVPLYFYSTVSELTCLGGDGGGTCEYIPAYYPGFRGESTTTADGIGFVSGRIAYNVPLQTSVVQFVTLRSTQHWQRPFGGYGVISYSDTIDRPAELIALDADGNEIGRWEMSD